VSEKVIALKSRNANIHLSVVFAGMAVMAPLPPASAQVVGAPPTGYAAGGDPLGVLSPSPMAQRSLNDKPVRDYQGLPFEGWMLYPSFFLGAVFDDNVYQSTNNRVAAAGVKVRPSIVADRDAGIHHSTLFANGDFNVYPGASGADTTNAQVGFSHKWEALRDFVFSVGGEYDRRTDIYNNGVVTTPFGIGGVVASPQRYNTFGGYVSGLKSFDRFFIGLSASSYATTYDALYTASGSLNQAYRDNLVTTVTGRLGYSITPLLYAYAESAGNFHDFSGASTYDIVAPNVPSAGTIYNSEGYRAVGGLGTDRIGLFKGEIYAGYQQQLYDYRPFGSPSSPVYGGKISWFPTRAWTITAALDETYQDSGLTTSHNLTGSAAHVTAATTNIQYAMAREWTASVYGGYADVVYVSGGRHDRRWIAGSTLNYEIMRNLYATFNYSYVLVESNALDGSFTRNQFSLGGTYKY
jgi:hypothetical protein